MTATLPKPEQKNKTRETIVFILIMIPVVIGLTYGLISFGEWTSFNQDMMLNGFSDADKITDHCFIGGPNGMSGGYTCIGGDASEKLRACWIASENDESVIGNGTLYEMCGGAPPHDLWQILHWKGSESKS